MQEMTVDASRACDLAKHSLVLGFPRRVTWYTWPTVVLLETKGVGHEEVHPLSGHEETEKRVAKNANNCVIIT